LDALSKLGDDGRGIAVIDPAMTATETLTEYRRRGIRGLRINLYSPVKTPGVASLEAGFAAIADVARSMNWHIQVIAPLPILLRNADLLAQSPVPVVIDHYGLYGGAQPGDADGQRLLGLLGHPHVWVKLSAPYRFAGGPLCTIPDRDWLHAILERAPSRSVWGSDWPHPPAHDTHQGANIATPYRALSYAALVDDFIAMLPSAAFADAVMRDNPARLYDF
jgi:predicted TIM-barrel fold metal-dependent hydrolase